jgi:hypothetical protein
MQQTGGARTPSPWGLLDTTRAARGKELQTKQTKPDTTRTDTPTTAQHQNNRCYKRNAEQPTRTQRAAMPNTNTTQEHKTNTRTNHT